MNRYVWVKSMELLLCAPVFPHWRQNMAGISVDGSSGGRRSLDSELNMVPMIDLLMVTISFLLITAVWSHSARLDASAKVPGQIVDDGSPKDAEEASLHVRSNEDGNFLLEWKQGKTVLSFKEVPRKESVSVVKGKRIVRFAELEKEIAAEWGAHGVHREASDPKTDRAVLHANNDAQYSTMVAMLDAMGTPERQLKSGVHVPAFATVLATD
jgi:biopolymer transport protein ExbD